MLFGGGFALGVVTTVLGFVVFGPELTSPGAEDAAVAEESLEDAPPSAAKRAPEQQLAAAEPQPSAAVDPPPSAAPTPTEPPLAAAADGTETTPSAATAAPAESDKPQAAAEPAARPQPAPAPQLAPAVARPTPAPASPAPSAPAPARAAPPAAPIAKAEPAAPPPKPAPPVDPDSQDAKLAAAAQVHQNAGTPIDSMLDQAFSPTAAKAEKPAAPSAVPPTPTRDDVIKAMSVLVPAIRGCAQGQSGMAPVSIVVHSDGRVESAALSSGPFQGTASGRCMEGVVRRARFPRFSQPSFRVQFPFAIQ